MISSNILTNSDNLPQFYFEENFNFIKLLTTPIKNFKNDIITFEIKVENPPKFKFFIQDVFTSIESEKYYVKALKNLLKKINVYELYQQLNNDIISEQEFNEEITNNKEKYVIDLKNQIDKKDIFIINKIIEKIGFDLTCDTIAEMFSLDPLTLDSILEKG